MATKTELERAKSIDPNQATGSVKSKHPTLRTLITSKFINCWIGPGNKNDYVVQLEPSHPQRTLPEDLTDACKIVRKHLVGMFPRTCEVEIDLPSPDWKVQHITFLVKGAMKVWSFQPDDVAKVIPALLNELDEYAEAYARFKRKP